MLKISFFLIVVGSVVGSSDPVVQISNGKVLGKTLNTLDNKTFFAFQGIPFAKPPVNELRFQVVNDYWNPSGWRSI